MAMSSTSPDDARLEGGPSTGDSSRSRQPGGTDPDLGDFESVGYYGEPPDEEALRAELRLRDKRAKEQARAAARAAQGTKARYAQMNPNDHEMSEQDRRIDGAEVAVVASAVVSQFQNLYPDFTRNRFIQAGISWAPLVLLKPRRRGDGFGALASDPRVWSFALMEGLTFFSEAGRKVNQLAEDLSRGAARPDEIARSTGESTDDE
jgi:hypothetical protein